MSSYSNQTGAYTSNRAGTPNTSSDRSISGSEEWSDITDPGERRRVQNRLAQRRFRDKAKESKEEAEREVHNQRRAGNAYSAPEPRQIDQRHELSGLPWGGVSLKHIIESGKIKEQQSQRSSRESSVYAAASRTGGSSRLGLHLTDQFARGYPAWKLFPYQRAGWR